MFPQCSQFPVREDYVSSVSFCFQDANYAYATRQGILSKIRACEHEQASTHLIFASNSSKGQVLRAPSNWMGPFDTPAILEFLTQRHKLRTQFPFLLCKFGVVRDCSSQRLCSIFATSLSLHKCNLKSFERPLFTAHMKGINLIY